ncbi:MAG: ATP-binding cassette domain-containing protein [Cellvibrionaceae bacterium]
MIDIIREWFIDMSGVGIGNKILLSVKDVGLDYVTSRGFFKQQKYTALEGISFDLFAGESLGIIGRNGAGKSSLLRMLAGIIYPDRGEVINHGAKVALMALQVGFDNELSGRKNIFLSGLLLGFDQGGIESRMADIIAFSELGSFLEQPVKTYSAGMRARLGFSICYILQPEVLLIDEVLGVGDVEFRQKSSKAMRERIQSDQTVVLVSHDAATIKNLCTRAVWIEESHVRMIGDAAEVIDAYQQYVLENPR